MSRPCFALSVMLCCLAGPLLVIGKTQAQDTGISPSHGPGECIVCPLAHGPLDACGGYSDYDYNDYCYGDYWPAADAPQTEPELDVADSLTDDSTEEAWESEYEDYYADYAFGDDAARSAADDTTLEEAPTPTEVIEAASEGPAVPVEATPTETPFDYEAYEEEWFSFGAEPTVETEAVEDSATDEAYEALSESASEARDEEIAAQAAETQLADEAWGDEEAWYRDEYGYEGTIDDEAAEAAEDLEPAGQLETGYDPAYDNAMAGELEAAEPAENTLPEYPDTQLPGVQLPEVDVYEPFYDAFDDLYNFESSPVESRESGTTEATVEPVAERQSPQAMSSEPAWLKELVDRMLAPVWTAAGCEPLNASLAGCDAGNAIYVDECAQWDCEADYWAQPEPDQPSVVLSAADTLDGMAAVLQNAATYLRAIASGSLADTARVSKDEPSR